MRFRRLALFLIIVETVFGIISLSICNHEHVDASVAYDFTTSESIVLTNVPGTNTLEITSLVIENSGPAISIDSIKAECIGEWSFMNDSLTDWANLSADCKAVGIKCNNVDLSESNLTEQGMIENGESKEFSFSGHVGARRTAVNDETIANIITTVSIGAVPVSGTTYLYQNGTLVINELENNHVSNISEYGSVVATFPTYETGLTEWNSASTVPWLGDGTRTAIEKVYFDSQVNVSDMSYWFYNCSNIKDIDYTNLDCSSCTAMNHTFDGLSSMEYIDLCGLNTSNVREMDSIFANCSSVKRIYVDNTWSNAAVVKGSNVVEGSVSLIGGDGHEYDADADYSSLVYDSYDTPGYLTYNGADKCVITYDFNKTGYDFDSDFGNQIKSGDRFSSGGAGSQVHNPYTADTLKIRGFSTSKLGRTVYLYKQAVTSKGSSMTMYSVFYIR